MLSRSFVTGSRARRRLAAKQAAPGGRMAALGAAEGPAVLRGDRRPACPGADPSPSGPVCVPWGRERGLEGG